MKEEWLVPSDLSGTAAVLRNVLPFLFFLWLAPQLAAKSAVAPWLLAPFLGLAIYRITIVMHDCTHRALFRNARLNFNVGRILGAATGIDFQSFVTQHWRHHRIFGEPLDPQGFHYAGLNKMTPAGFRWHVFKPLLGLNMLRVFGESVLGPRNLARLIYSGEIFLVLAAQAIVLGIVTGWGEYPLLAPLPFASAATFGLFFSQLRGIAEHGAFGSDAAAGNVRSHAANFLDRLLLYDLNFNYHEEHHRFPGIPSCHLPTLRKALPAGFSQPRPSMFGTLASIHRALSTRHE